MTLESNWKTETPALHMEEVVGTHVAKWISVWLQNNTTIIDKNQADHYLKAFNTTLLNAEAIASQHAGFNGSGVVTDKIQAQQSVNELAADLHDLRSAIMDHILNLSA